MNYGLKFFSRAVIFGSALALSACTSNVAEIPGPDAGYQNNADETNTYSEQEVRLAAESWFGPGSEFMGRAVEDIFSNYGRPTAYITGVEVSAAVTVGGRIGNGMLYHKLEGAQKIMWTGPSLGLDFGMSGGEAFTLVYNLYDPEDLFQWIYGGEGGGYFAFGMNVNIQHDGDLTLVTFRTGLGFRIGINSNAIRFIKDSDDEEQPAS
jgi:hypothetical protein